MKSLIVYYSLSGTTRTVAEALAQKLSADIEEIRCARYRPHFSGFIRAGYDSWAGQLPPIERSQRIPSLYDLVVIGGPMWAFHVATPVRAYLRSEAGRLSSVALFLTHGGSPADKAFREMESLAGLETKGTLAVREMDVKTGAFRFAVSSFAAALQESKSTHSRENPGITR